MSALSLSHVQLSATTWTVAHQAPLSTEFSRQEYQVAGDQPQLIQGIRSGDGVGEDQETIA